VTFSKGKILILVFSLKIRRLAMQHPFEKIHPQNFKLYFWPLLAVTLGIMVLMNVVGAPLITPHAPSGIISYELAGSVSNAQAVLDSWNQDVRLHAAFSLGFDYLFMLAYSTTIALACLWAGGVVQRKNWPLAGVSRPLAWAQWLAALMDGVENLGLVLILFGPPASPWPEIARWSAVIKFTLIFLGMIYSFYGLAVSLLHRMAPGTD
jgi:hypothetical protein